MEEASSLSPPVPVLPTLARWLPLRGGLEPAPAVPAAVKRREPAVAEEEVEAAVAVAAAAAAAAEPKDSAEVRGPMHSREANCGAKNFSMRARVVVVVVLVNAPEVPPRGGGSGGGK